MTRSVWIFLLLSSVAMAQPSAPPSIGGTPGEAKAKPADVKGDDKAKPGDAKAKPADAKAKPDAKAKSKAPEDDEAMPEPPKTSVVTDILNSGLIGELVRGGLFMWPILLLGIVAAGVILERWRSLKMVATDSSALRNEVMQLLQADRVEEAVAKCDAQQGPVPAVLAVGLRKYLVLRRLNHDPAQVDDQVVRTMDDYGVHIVASLERHLPILATISSAAPMLGFLGTVQGMVVAFREIVDRMGETNIVALAAGGINIALLTTAFGLLIGIPAFIAYNYFTSVINRYVLQVEESATELIEAVTLKMALTQGDTKADDPAAAASAASA
ncbi:MAG TPA: MotA/TolQ/ExbB proton channel family protein [Phycisphaerae bacterium]|nr:MotA/TolQ/ExbB proton channel family protein [Phycisphaerae bacterium]